MAGLPLLRRIVLAGGRAGFARVLVHGLRGGVNGLLAETPAAALEGAEPLAAASRQRIVVMPANVVPQPQWLRGLREMPLEEETVYIDPATIAVVETATPERVLAVAAGSGSAGELVAGLRRLFPRPPRALDPAGRFPLRGPADLPRAETWLMRSLIKSSEGFMSRHFERLVSLSVTRRLLTTRVTPDAMTLVSVAIGLVGAPFFLSSRPAHQLAGGLLFLTHSILDGCDGELARIKFMESRRGAILDFWGDNLVHVAVFACMAIGWSLAAAATWPLLLGALAITSTIGSAAATSPQSRWETPAAGNGQRSFGVRLADSLAHRDFIYLVIALGAFGKAAWFLALVAAGAPLFLILVLWVGHRHQAG